MNFIQELRNLEQARYRSPLTIRTGHIRDLLVCDLDPTMNSRNVEWMDRNGVIISGQSARP